MLADRCIPCPSCREEQRKTRRGGTGGKEDKEGQKRGTEEREGRGGKKGREGGREGEEGGSMCQYQSNRLPLLQSHRILRPHRSGTGQGVLNTGSACFARLLTAFTRSSEYSCAHVTLAQLRT
eukprot:518300-Rhodomonas_salina.1